ncbi:molybdopterin molybdotransferase MoeA [Mucilaginibacter robiniae]|uniref:Molybdopterin molybdenumtransferase n=1 Tax=Mucilaginibacter robiniae TaxID=2728022 RepID=A0A7L5E450_9SPHI|nr:molybdopterin molybdotransferase MoeA [Mucilaginibacter robiniae]QJD95593.1 molybdopterin molybdotransferase MoeA [Mucilaginibacter robiniae]
MISVQEALSLVVSHKKDLSIETVDLLQSYKRILAQPVKADRDFPPFHRVTMDGIAINSTAFEQGQRSFTIEAIQPAGSPQIQLQSAQNCIEVMTGAMLPVNTNAVIRYEDLTIENQVATINLDTVTTYQNVHLQGTDEKAGNVLVQAGEQITPAIIAIMASVGLAEVQVYRLPKVAVCSTGDELVTVTEQPQAHQIRQSNSYMLLAALKQEGILANSYYLPDEPNAMIAQLLSMLQQYDVLLFSGAVSKGKFDFLPQVLQQLGMQTIFHSIAQKPGKPLLFGKFNTGAVVFGCPGNPVSTWVCYQLYFRTWLYVSLQQKPKPVIATLTKDIVFKPALTQHVLVKLKQVDEKLMAEPVDTSTSGDMVNLMQAEGFISLPAEQTHFSAGSLFPVLLFDN